MTTYDSSSAQCHIFTEKDGLLSAIAHDLEIKVTEFVIQIEGDTVQARLKADSLRVLHAMKEGKPFDTLSDKDKKEIEGNITKDVLNSAKFPEILFASTSVTQASDKTLVAGNLTLHGVTKALAINVTKDANGISGEFSIQQPDFGIKPYTAMLGTLKVKPLVRVRITIPAR